MKILACIAALMSATAVQASPIEFFAAPAYQEDFSSARLCDQMIYGHLVWQGEKAFYFQTEKAEIKNGLLTKGGGVTSIYLNNSPESLYPFLVACH